MRDNVTATECRKVTVNRTLISLCHLCRGSSN